MKRLNFIDLFTGIGGIRQGFELLFGTGVLSLAWDKFSQQTYQANFTDCPAGDITKGDTFAKVKQSLEALDYHLFAVNKKYTLSDKLRAGHQRGKLAHKIQGQWFWLFFIQCQFLAPT